MSQVQQPTQPSAPVVTPDNPAPVTNGSAFVAAYERKLSEITAIPEDEFATINIDFHNAVTTVLGVLSKIAELQQSILALPTIDPHFVTGLSDYAMAAGQANNYYTIATTPAEDILAMNDRAMKMRENFRSDATALANRGLIDPNRLAGFKGLVGYKNVAFELMGYADLMRDCWATIQGKTPITSDEIDAAKQLGESLVLAAGEREQGPGVIAATARIRQQALTLLLKAYDETRRAVVFLRWHQEDADTIAPSLYAGRGGKKHDAPPAPTPPAPTPPAPVPPVVTPTNGAANLNGQPPVPAGHPGSPAFGA